MPQNEDMRYLLELIWKYPASSTFAVGCLILSVTVLINNGMIPAMFTTGFMLLFAALAIASCTD